MTDVNANRSYQLEKTVTNSKILILYLEHFSMGDGSDLVGSLNGAAGDSSLGVVNGLPVRLQKLSKSQPYANPQATLPLINRYIDEPRPLRVAVIGGGLSGILAGVLLPEKVPGIQLTIYDKNYDFVGRSQYSTVG